MVYTDLWLTILWVVTHQFGQGKEPNTDGLAFPKRGGDLSLLIDGTIFAIVADSQHRPAYKCLSRSSPNIVRSWNPVENTQAIRNILHYLKEISFHGFTDHKNLIRDIQAISDNYLPPWHWVHMSIHDSYSTYKYSVWTPFNKHRSFWQNTCHLFWSNSLSTKMIKSYNYSYRGILLC